MRRLERVSGQTTSVHILCDENWAHRGCFHFRRAHPDRLPGGQGPRLFEPVSLQFAPEWPIQIGPCHLCTVDSFGLFTFDLHHD